MGFIITKAGQGLASLIIIGAVGYGFFKIIQLLFNGIKANKRGRRK
jgi:hypothetical protein